MVHFIYLKGYHGTSLREVAERAGIRMSTLYYYFPSKQGLLLEIMSRTLKELTAAVRESLVTAQLEEPAAQLRLAIAAHVRFHAERHEEAFVADSELRALDPGNREAVTALRDEHEDVFANILRSAQRYQLYRGPDEQLAVNALLGMCSQVATWYRPDGRLTIDEIARSYSDLIIGGLMEQDALLAGRGFQPTGVESGRERNGRVK